MWTEGALLPWRQLVRIGAGCQPGRPGNQEWVGDPVNISRRLQGPAQPDGGPCQPLGETWSTRSRKAAAVETTGTQGRGRHQPEIGGREEQWAQQELGSLAQEERPYVPEQSPAAVLSGVPKPGWVKVVTCHLPVEAPGPTGGPSCWPFLSASLGSDSCRLPAVWENL